MSGLDDFSLEELRAELERREQPRAVVVRTEWTREELIALCERAIVPQDKWRNRDSYSAQRNIGDAWSLLRAGCEFTVLVGEGRGCYTDARIIWIETYAHGFGWFEGGCENEPQSLDEETHYIPTPHRLDEVGGEDWYC